MILGDKHEDIPRINLPKQSREYKIVQLDIEGQPYLRFAEKDWYTHAIIIMDLAHKLHRPYHTVEKDRGSMFGGKDEIPALQSDWYTVHGMGKSKISVEHKSASFYGKSIDYGIGIDIEHLGSVRVFARDWEFTVEGS